MREVEKISFEAIIIRGILGTVHISCPVESYLISRLPQAGGKRAASKSFEEGAKIGGEESEQEGQGLGEKVKEISVFVCVDVLGPK